MIWNREGGGKKKEKEISRVLMGERGVEISWQMLLRKIIENEVTKVEIGKSFSSLLFSSIEFHIEP